MDRETANMNFKAAQTYTILCGKGEDVMTYQQKVDRKEARICGKQAIRSIAMSFAAAKNETGNAEIFAEDAAWWARMAARNAYYAHPELKEVGA